MRKQDLMPPALAGLAPELIVELDVREELRAGREPFSPIMAARQRVAPGGALRLRALFEPVPLYRVLARQGFDHWTEQLGPDDWSVWFYAASLNDQGEVGAAAQAAPVADDVVVLDVRGLEPPEPLLRTLEQLERLPAGATLVQVNERVPQFLLPQLRSRGYTWEIVEEGGAVRVFISKEC